jgi:hypothetical protein
MVRVYTDYDPIRILYNVEGDFDENAQKSGLTGNFVLVDEKDLPADRSNRLAWSVSGGKVVEDADKKAALEQGRIQKRNRISMALAKLGITEEEFKLLRSL